MNFKTDKYPIISSSSVMENLSLSQLKALAHETLLNQSPRDSQVSFMVDGTWTEIGSALKEVQESN